MREDERHATSPSEAATRSSDATSSDATSSGTSLREEEAAAAMQGQGEAATATATATATVAAVSPTSILAAAAAAAGNVLGPPVMDINRRILVPDDRAIDELSGGGDGGTPPGRFMQACMVSPSSSGITPRRKSSVRHHRSRDLPRRVLLPDVGTTTTTTTTRKRPSSAIQAPVTPAKRRPSPGTAALSLSTVVEEAAAACTVDPGAASSAAAPEAPELLVEFDRRMTVAVEQQEDEQSQLDSPRTPPRTSVSTIPVTPMAPMKRERTSGDKMLPSAASSSVRRLDFGEP